VSFPSVTFFYAFVPFDCRVSYLLMPIFSVSSFTCKWKPFLVCKKIRKEELESPSTDAIVLSLTYSEKANVSARSMNVTRWVMSFPLVVIALTAFASPQTLFFSSYGRPFPPLRLAFFSIRTV